MSPPRFPSMRIVPAAAPAEWPATATPAPSGPPRPDPAGPQAVAPASFPLEAGSGFRIGRGERLAASLRRVALEQFDHAILGLTGSPAGRAGAGDRDEAIHEARKAIKRLRAVLRLVRDQVGADVYRAENSSLRDTGRCISGIRDRAVVVETVDGLGGRFQGLLAPGAFQGIRDQLGGRLEVTRARLLDDEDLLGGIVRAMRAARARYAAWPAGGGRLPVSDSFASLAPGLERTYRRGRREMAVAYRLGAPEAFHAWRKRVKYLRHQLELLEGVWPVVVGGLAGELEELGDLLGDEHDLGELTRHLEAEPGLCPDPVERSLLTALARQRSRELRVEARGLGARLYFERPGRFVDRLGGYWRVWREPGSTG